MKTFLVTDGAFIESRANVTNNEYKIDLETSFLKRIH